MQMRRRLVWWKVAFWAAVGCGCGGVAVARWPRVGRPPSGAMRLSVEQFVVTVTDAPTPADGVAGVVLYPPEVDGVQLITFDLRSGGVTRPAYTFGTTPFLTADRLEQAATAGRRTGARRRPAVAALGPSLARATADVAGQPRRRWATAESFLDHVRAARPGFAYAAPWWAGPPWVRWVPVWVGGLLVGGVGGLLTRRVRAVPSPAAEPALAPAPSPAGPVVLAEVVAYADALAAEATTAPAQPAPPAPPAPAPVVGALASEPLTVAAEAAEEDKAYAGEFYPTVRGRGPGGFSLVELLVAIAIVGILTAMLLPALVVARRSADTITCAGHLHEIGQGMAIYLAENRDTFPAAYLYIGHRIEHGAQWPTLPSAGYVHWSSYLYGRGSVPASAFTCPAMRQGGLPPTNTPPGNRDPGQVCPAGSIVDRQAVRLAYTVNEALCPRNKFVAPSFGAGRSYRFVRSAEVRHPSATILATEMVDDDVAISYDDQGTHWVMSHRPIHGFVSASGELDLYYVPVGQGFRPARRDDLDPDPPLGQAGSRTRLNLVGRNHGPRDGSHDLRLSNFLYVDGHVATRSVYDTVDPFEWGERFYSLTPNSDEVGAD